MLNFVEQSSLLTSPRKTKKQTEISVMTALKRTVKYSKLDKVNLADLYLLQFCCRRQYRPAFRLVSKMTTPLVSTQQTCPEYSVAGSIEQKVVR